MLEEPWRVTLCGGLSARQGTHSVSRFRTQKTGLLLAYLALHGERAHGREELAELFWPESDQPRHSLRLALASLRQQLEPPGVGRGQVLAADRSHVRLAAGTVRTDVAVFQTAAAQAAQAGEAEEKARLLQWGVEAVAGELLPGSYLEWVLQAREVLAEQLQSALAELAALLSARGEWEQALAYALRRVHLNALNEAAHVAVLGLLVRLKRPGQVRQQFERLSTLLWEEMGVRPCAEACEMAEAAAGAEQQTLSGAEPEALSGAAPAEAGRRLARKQTAAAVPAVSVRAVPVVRLPLPLTPFFGREKELLGLCALLEAPAPADDDGFMLPPPVWKPRVVTLLGTGGSGKTRLAIEAARACAAAESRRVCFVALADADTPDHIVQSIAEAVCPNAPRDSLPLDAVLSALGAVPALLVLDNMEQIAEAGAEVVGDLLQRLPDLTVLVTSRVRLNLDGEREFVLSPLPTPEQADTPECLLEFASVQLFVDRAQAACADFQLTARNAANVAALCRRLEGLPLALELAASWAQTLSPAQMLARLDRRFELLRARRRGVAVRHQALEVCIEWSFRLLPPEVQAFFCRLCLLRGEWTLETAAIVAGESDVLEKVQRLRDASFLLSQEVPQADGPIMRFHMLESLREFGLERLDPREVNAGYERLTRHFSALSGSDPFATVDTENVRVVVSWCRLSASGNLLELDLLNALMHFWGNRGGWVEGREWVQAALERQTGEATPAQRQAWNTLGFLYAMLGDDGQARDCFERVLADSKRAEDPVMAVRALSNLAIIAVREGDSSQGCALMEQSLHQAERLGEVRIISTQNYNVGAAHLELGHYEEARRFLDRSLQQSREQDFPGGIALCLSSLAQLARKEGDSLSARQMLEESLEIFRAAGEQPRMAEVLDRLVELLAEQGDAFQSRVYADESTLLHKSLRGD